MGNINNFKEFVRNNPSLVSYVRDGRETWQHFYELYDLYGEDLSIWNKYLSKEENRKLNISNILDYAKNIDTDKLQEGITSIQKAIDLFGGMIKKEESPSSNNYSPRPIYRRFDD